MDWDGFKQTEFAVRCETDKVKFFEDCKKNGIHVFLTDRAKERNIFVCVRRYESRVSGGRYELFALMDWQIKPGALYGKIGLEERLVS